MSNTNTSITKITITKYSCDFCGNEYKNRSGVAKSTNFVGICNMCIFEYIEEMGNKMQAALREDKWRG